MVASFSDDFEGGTLGASVSTDDGTYLLQGVYVTGRTGLGLGDGGSGAVADYYGSPGVATEGTASCDVLIEQGESTLGGLSDAHFLPLMVLGARDKDGDPASFATEYVAFGIYVVDGFYRWGYQLRDQAATITAYPVTYGQWHTMRYAWDATTLTISVLDDTAVTLWSQDHTFGTLPGLENHRPGAVYSQAHLTNLDRGNVIIDNLGFSTVAAPPPIIVTEPATRLFPRDDSLGLGSAPRLVPPPRRGRVVGGYQ